MHFVYKLDHPFQSTRVSHENSSVTKTFHFSKLISTQDFFLHSTCNIQSHILKIQPFLTSFAIFHAFNDFFELNDPVIGKHYHETQKRLKLGMVSSFEPHRMCAKVGRITTKNGCTSCTTWTISFKVQGFLTKTHLLQRNFIFLRLFQLKTFFASNMQHSKPHTEISTLSDFICYFSCI